MEVSEIRYGRGILTNVSLRLRGSQGRIAAELVGASIGTTDLDGRADLDVTGTVPAVSFQVEGKKIDIGQLLKIFDVTEMISASVDIDARGAGRGRSLQEIIATLDGEASVIAEQGRIDSKYFDLVAVDLVRELIPWRSKSQHSDINCFVARFDIREGVAVTDSLLLDTTRTTIAGEGSIDLRTEALNFTVRPRPKQASLVSLAFPIDVRGTIASPKFRPNKKALAVDAAKLVVGAAINPLGILVPFVKAGVGDSNPCLSALEAQPDSMQVGRQGYDSGDTKPKGVGGRLLKGLGRAVKGLGGAVGKVLGE